MTRESFSLSSPGLDEEHRVHREHTCDGKNVPPALAWKNVPSGTKSLALILDDPDAPSGTFTHWLLWDIAPDAGTNGPADLSESGVAGRNDFRNVGYGGPCPPANHGAHRYQFHVYALDQESLGLPVGASRVQLERAMQDHILAEGEIVGRYAR